MEGGREKERTLGRLSCDTIAYWGASGPDRTSGRLADPASGSDILSRWGGRGVPSRTAIVCRPGCKNSNRQVAARCPRGQAGRNKLTTPTVVFVLPSYWSRVPNSGPVGSVDLCHSTKTLLISFFLHDVQHEQQLANLRAGCE